MRFYFYNNAGDSGYFSERNLIKAIYAAWNIEANLFIVKNIDKVKDEIKLIFAPWDSNEFNSDLLKEFGYKMIDGEEEREVVKIKTGKVVKYSWNEVKQLC